MSDQRILFAKAGTARYISHLDLMHTMERAFLRADITIRHTEGFHPHPYVSIPLPLPLGFSSQCELLEFGLVSGSTVDTLPARMNQALPTGITILDCYDASVPFRKLAFVRYQLTLEFDRSLADSAAIDFQSLVSRDSLVITKKSKKAKSGQTEVNLIPLIEQVEAISPQGNVLHITLLLQAQNPGMNPNLLLSAFQATFPQYPVVYTSCHRQEIFDSQKQVYR